MGPRLEVRPLSGSGGNLESGTRAAMRPAGNDPFGLTRAQSLVFEAWLASTYANDPLAVPRWTDRELAVCAQLNREIGWEASADAINHAGRELAIRASRTVWRLPRYAELVERRKPSTDPCPTRCGRCSRCIRAVNVRNNRRRYGQDDHPGADAMRRASSPEKRAGARADHPNGSSADQDAARLDRRRR